jgi:hypothetical protein
MANKKLKLNSESLIIALKRDREFDKHRCKTYRSKIFNIILFEFQERQKMAQSYFNAVRISNYKAKSYIKENTAKVTNHRITILILFTKTASNLPYLDLTVRLEDDYKICHQQKWIHGGNTRFSIQF